MSASTRIKLATAKIWTLFALDLVVMFAVTLMTFDALTEGFLDRLPPWQVSAVVAALTGFAAIGVRDFWPERYPRHAAKIVTTESTAR
jgi:sterol desaturase/sphingolipid hydroxylase (fatty acid hydroxylase superfamily)